MRFTLFLFMFLALGLPASAETAAQYYGKALETETPTKRVRLLGKALAEDAAYAPAYFLRAQAAVDMGDCAAALPDLGKTIELGYEPARALYYRGSCLLELGQSTAALADYTAVIASAPESASGYYRRAVAYLELRDSSAALADLDYALCLDPGYIPAYPRRARLRCKAGAYGPAAEDFTAAIKAGFGGGLQAERGAAYLALNNYSAALCDYETALEANTSDYAALTGSAQAYLGLKNATAAVTAAEKAVAVNPADKTAYLLLARAYELKPDSATAMLVLSSAAVIFPSDAEILLGMAQLAFDSGDFAGAVARSSAALAAVPDSEQAFYLRGKACFRLADYACAIDDIKKAVALRPKDVSAHVLLAQAYYLSGDIKAGGSETLTALNIDYERTASKLSVLKSTVAACGLNTALGTYELNRLEPAKAKPWFDKAVAVSSECWQAYGGRSQANRLARKFPAALTDITRAIALQENDWELYLERGKLYYELRQNDKAYRDFVQAQRMNPAGAESYNYSGRMFLRVKMYGKAEEEFTKALSLTATPDLYANRALARLRQNNIEGAKTDLEEALKLNPADPKTYIGLACYYWSAANDRAKALDNLEQAFKAGFNRYSLLTHASGYGNYLSGLDADADYVALIEKYSSPAQASALSADYD